MGESETITCPHCGATGTGRFCASCGGERSGGGCAACGAATTTGAEFCGGCGAPLGAGGGGRRQAGSRRWVGGLLGGMAVVVVAWAMVGSSPTATNTAAAPAGPAVAPDISDLTPREQFGRLAERIETAMVSGDTATVVQFFPMVEAAFADLPDGDRDIDARLHLSLLRARVGHAATAVAQADSIAAESPNHLFADYLRAIIADYQGDPAAATAARQAFRSHFATEVATDRPEYQLHRQMLDQFLATIPDPAAP